MIPTLELQAEIINDPLGLGYDRASASIIRQKMTAPGSAGNSVYIVASSPRPVDKTEFLQILDESESAAMLDTLATPATVTAKAMVFKLSQTPTIDMTKAGNRKIVQNLQAALDLPATNLPLKAATVTAILRKGESLEHRSHALWGEDPTVEEIHGVLNG